MIALLNWLIFIFWYLYLSIFHDKYQSYKYDKNIARKSATVGMAQKHSFCNRALKVSSWNHIFQVARHFIFSFVSLFIFSPWFILIDLFDQATMDAAFFAAVTSHLISVAGNTPDQPWSIHQLSISSWYFNQFFPQTNKSVLLARPRDVDVLRHVWHTSYKTG